MEYFLLVILIVCALFDMKERLIPVLILYMGIAVITFYTLMELMMGRTLIIGCFFSLLPSIIILLFAKMNFGMGAADGMLLYMIGLLCGYQKTLIILMEAFLLAGMASFLILLSKKGDRKTEIAFIPFLLVAFVHNNF